jgi:hypothetical protein
MLEQLSAHVAFHLRTHHVSLKIDEQRAYGLECDQREHDHAQAVDLVERAGRALLYQQVLGDEIRAYRKQQCRRRYDDGADKVCEQQPSIWPVV